ATPRTTSAAPARPTRGPPPPDPPTKGNHDGEVDGTARSPRRGTQVRVEALGPSARRHRQGRRHGARARRRPCGQGRQGGVAAQEGGDRDDGRGALPRRGAARLHRGPPARAVATGAVATGAVAEGAVAEGEGCRQAALTPQA